MPRATTASAAALCRIAARADYQPDERLLRRFAADRHEESFRAIVRRHGGMVLDVCRSVLRNDADAEDAFQAVFLALATSAGRIRAPAALAGWLHSAACRTARKARLSRGRRQTHESRVPAPAMVVPSDPSWAEAREAIHEEVHRLPERYRLAIVLFYMAGLTQDEVGSALGLSKDGAKKRLERGRALLRMSLERRGFGAVAVLAAAAFGPSPAPAALTAATSTLATRHAAGTATAPPAILRLAATGAKPMLTRMVVGATSLLAVATAIAFVDLGIRASDGAGSDPPAPAAKGLVVADAPAPRAAGPRFKVRVSEMGWKGRCAFLDGAHILVRAMGNQKLEVRDARTGKLVQAVPAPGLIVGDFRLSADRTRVAAATTPDPTGTFLPPRIEAEITVWDTATWTVRGTIGSRGLLALAGDGRTMLVRHKGQVEVWDSFGEKMLKAAPFEFQRIDAAALAPDGSVVAVSGLNEIVYWKWRNGDKYDRLNVGRKVDDLLFSPDGKFVAEGPDSRRTVEVRDVATLKVVQALSDAAQPRVPQMVAGMAFADGGKELVFGNRVGLIESIPVPNRVHFWDVASGGLTRQVDLKGAGPIGLDVSPDGKTLAVVIGDGDGIALAAWDLDPAPHGQGPNGPPGLQGPPGLPRTADLQNRIEAYERAFRAQTEAGSGHKQPKPAGPGPKKNAVPPGEQLGPAVRNSWLELTGRLPTENEVVVAALCWAVKEQMQDREFRPWLPGGKAIRVDWPLDDRFERFAALDLCGVLPSQVKVDQLRGVWLDLYGLPLTKEEKDKAAIAWLKLRKEKKPS
jgi:RNA polymerase sigma factor (sigma-70 family)